MKIRGLLYDLARNQSADIEHLQRVIDNLASFDFNFLLINLENRFEFSSCPDIAPQGSMSAEMATSLVRYGKTRGIEVVAQGNFIGHCEAIAATELYAHLSCDPYLQMPWGGYEQLNLELPEARDLVRRMMNDILAAFPGDYLHIGCDEVRRMEYLFPTAPDRQLQAITEHFRYVLNLARQSERKIMIWGDMPLRYPQLLEDLPRDIIICDWHYEPEGSRSTLAQYKQAGFSVLSCPAINTWDAFAVSTEETFGNLSTMIGDALELDLDGVLLTTWEFGCGSGFDITWPWVAMAGEMVNERKVGNWQASLAKFGKTRYDVDGDALAALHQLLHQEVHTALPVENGLLSIGTLRKLLFRGAPLTSRTAGSRLHPVNPAQSVWDPSPFHIWLFLRPKLSNACLQKLEDIAARAEEAAAHLEASQSRHRHELRPLLILAKAFGILVERLQLLQKAKADYHQAALAQGREAREGHLDEVVESLEALRPGLVLLQNFVRDLDATNGLDPNEAEWLDIQMKSLNEHIEAIQQFSFDDPLLEFGEFLRRPVHVQSRLTWR